MVPERLLVGGALSVVVVSVVAAAAVPGAVQPDEPGPVRPAMVQIADVHIAPGDVTGDAATLAVETRLAHSGGPAENVTVLLRAVDSESGMVETTRALEVEPIRDGREVAVPGNLTVERDGGYRIESVLYLDGERADHGERTVRGVEALTPEYARTSVEFHRFARTDHPVVEYSVADVEDDQVTLQVGAYLTNTGSDVTDDLRLSLSARQAESNVVADRAEVDVGGIEAGRTATPEVELVVPDGYNYYLDAVLWKDGVVVGTARSAANLDPTETIDADVTEREVGLEVSDFERDRGRPRPEPTPERTAVDTDGQPGFTAALGVVALLGAALLVRRWST